MTWRGPTYRMVDGERIDGAWCHVWRRSPWHEEHYLDDLFVFADGSVRSGEWTDLPGLEKSLASGLIAVREPGTPVPQDDRSKWESRWSEPLTPEGFLLEVADKVEELAGRPTVGQRCRDAIRRFRRDPDEAGRDLLRQAYLAVPPHLRIYVLGDMDRQDRPLRILLTDVGTAVDGDGPVVTADMHRAALDYFGQGDEGVAAEREALAVRHADDPAAAGSAAFRSYETVHPRGWPDELGPFVLRNDYPAPVTFAGETYPSVLHGYWALSTARSDDHDRIRDTESAREAHASGGGAQRRADWHRLRLAVMRGLLEAKFTQHPELAEVLLATGDGPIGYTGFSDSPFWREVSDHQGRNWMGRLLEVVRSEILARRAFPTG